MTASAEEQRRQVDATHVWRAIAQFEGKQNMMLKRIEQIARHFDNMEARFTRLEARVDRLEAKVERLLYAMIAIGGALFVAIFASRFVG